MAAYVPPLFSKFTKNIDDLFDKNFKHITALKLKTTTANGVSTENLIEATDRGTFVGGLKLKYTHADIGLFEGEFRTDNVLNASVKADKLHKNVVVNVKGVENTTDVTANSNVEFKHDYVSGSVEVENVWKHKEKAAGLYVRLSGAVGYDGVAVGGLVDHNQTAGTTEYHAGALYEQPDFNFSLKTKRNKNFDGLVGSWFHTYSPDFTYGLQAEINWEDRKTDMTLGGSYRLDRDLFVKVKGNVNKSLINTSLQQKLYNPSVQYFLTTEFNARTPTKGPEKFGVSFVFGDADNFQ